MSTPDPVTAPEPVAAPASPSEPRTASRPFPRRGIMIALSIAAVVLLATTALFGTTLLSALGEHAGAVAQPTTSGTPTATPEPEDETATVRDIPITVGETPLAFGTWAAGPWEDDRVSLFVPVTNDSTTQAVKIFYDLTAYDADGRIVQRRIVIAQLLPDSEQILEVGPIRSAPEKIASLVLEQTDIVAQASPFTGSATAKGVESPDRETGSVTATIDPSLTPTPRYMYFQAAAFVDDAMIGVCDVLVESTTESSLESCYLSPVSSGTTQGQHGDVQPIPADAELRAFVRVEFDLE